MMKAVVMDIRDGKRAIVLDENGRFRMIANDKYRIGQTVQVKKISRWVRPTDYKKANAAIIIAATATAVCLAAILHSTVKDK